MPQFRLSEEQLRVYAPQVVALELGAEKMTFRQIAKELGVALNRVMRIRESEEYKRCFHEATRRAEKSVERMTRENTLEIRQKLSEYSGEAIERVLELMRQNKDMRVALTAACELIDRDGRFAKVSRLMNVDQGKDGAPMLPEDVSAEILQHINSAKVGMVQ